MKKLESTVLLIHKSSWKILVELRNFELLYCSSEKVQNAQFFRMSFLEKKSFAFHRSGTPSSCLPRKFTNSLSGNVTTGSRSSRKSPLQTATSGPWQQSSFPQNLSTSARLEECLGFNCHPWVWAFWLLRELVASDRLPLTTGQALPGPTLGTKNVTVLANCHPWTPFWALPCDGALA